MIENIEVLIVVAGLPFVAGYLLFSAYRWSRTERQKILNSKKAWTDEDVMRELAAGNYSYAHKLWLFQELGRGENLFVYVVCITVLIALAGVAIWFFYPLFVHILTSWLASTDSCGKH